MFTKYTCKLKDATIIFVNSAEKNSGKTLESLLVVLVVHVCVCEGKEGGSHVEEQQMDTHG